MRTNSSFWNSAAINGLLFSLITIITSLLQSAFNIQGILAILLWCVKFGGCVYLLYYYMKQYSNNAEYVTYGESFKYGFALCVFSSIVCACYIFISMTWLFPETVDIAMEQIQTAIATGAYTSEQEDAIFNVADKLPQLTLITCLIYYILIGAVMSSIIANFTKKTDPFAENNN